MRRQGFVLLLLLAGPLLAADWAGEYANGQLSLVLEAAGQGYRGTLTFKGTAYPVEAAERNGRLEGKFVANNASFEFIATLHGDRLVLASGGKTHELLRKQATANPLDDLGETPAPPPGTPGNPGPPAPVPGPPPAAGQAQAIAALRSLGPPQEDPQRRWTILVYLDADNNLEGPGLEDFNEMEAAIPTSGVEVIVLIDRAKGYANEDGDWTDARLCRIRPHADRKLMNSPVLARLGEVNMGDPELLAAFVEGAFRAYPAPNHMLVLWDHGGGWAAMASDDDDGAGNHDGLDLPKMSAALGRGLGAAGVARLDLLGFDMCLMGQLETAVEATPFARIMVASQAMEPGAGWPYDRVLPLFADARADAAALGAAIAKVYDEDYDARKDRTTTCCCLDLDRTADVVGGMNQLLEKIHATLPQHWPVVARALFFSESYMGRSDFRKGTAGVNSLDLKDVLRRLKHNIQPFPAEAEYQELLRRLGGFVLASHVNKQFRLSGGLSIYGPVSRGAANPAYFQLSFGRMCRWASFLRDLFELQAKDVTPPVIKETRILDHAGNQIGAVKPLAGNQFQGVIEGKNIIWAMTQDGVRDDRLGGVRVFGRSLLLDDQWVLRYEQAQKEAAHELDLLLPVFRDGETTVRTEFDGLRLVVTNGQERREATFDVSGTERSGTVPTQALLEHPALGDKPVLAVIGFDRRLWTVASVVLLNTTPDGRVEPRPLSIEKGLPADLKVRPIQELVKPDGKTDLVANDAMDWGQGLRMVMELTPPGEYEAVLTIETMGDVSSSSRFRYRVEEDPELSQWAQEWKIFKPEHLVGTWDLQVIGEDGKPKAANRTYRIRQHPDEPGHYQADVEGPGEGEKHVETWIPDLSGFPCIRQLMFVDDEEGMLIVPAIFGIREGKARILGKMIDIGGMLWIWEKREPVTSDLERIQPVDVPEPEPLR